MTKWIRISVCFYHFHIQLIKCRHFFTRSFWIGCQEQVVTKWILLWPYEHWFHFSDGIFSFSWPTWETFAREVFRFGVSNRLWQNDLICDQMNTHLTFWYHFRIQLIKWIRTPWTGEPRVSRCSRSYPITLVWPIIAVWPVAAVRHN